MAEVSNYVVVERTSHGKMEVVTYFPATNAELNDYIDTVLSTIPGEFYVLCLEYSEAHVNNTYCRAVHCSNVAEYRVHGKNVCGIDLPSFIEHSVINEVSSLRS